MADCKFYVFLVYNSGRDIPLKSLERRIAVAKRKHPKAKMFIRIVNR